MWELPPGQRPDSPPSQQRSEAAAKLLKQLSSRPEAAAMAEKAIAQFDSSAHKPELCIGDESPGVGGVPVDGQSCDPVSAVVQHGEVSFSGAGGPSFPVTITVVVPNGVESVEVTEADGSSRSVKVENNVALAVVQGGENALPHQPATAVSYRMPDGRVQNVMAFAH